MIQPVTEHNLTLAAQIHSDSWRASHRALCSAGFVRAHTMERQREWMSAEVGRGKAFYLLTLDAPRGTVSVCRSLIEHLYVLPSQQGKGYGTLLLHYAEGLCPGEPHLWVFRQNEKAFAFYLRNGYLFTGRRNRYGNFLEELELARGQGDGKDIYRSRRRAGYFPEFFIPLLSRRKGPPDGHPPLAPSPLFDYT